MSFRTLSRIVLVEDDDAFREALTERLRLSGFDVSAFASAEAALKALNDGFEGVVVTDLRMPGLDGRALVERLTAMDPDLPVVMMTGHGDIAEAVDAMKRGAYDFLAKPFAPERLIESLRRALDKRSLVLDNRRLAALSVEGEWSIPLSGESRSVEALRAAIQRLADARVDVLIEGETGAGKEAVARAIHNAGRRRLKPFVAVSCAALPETGLESLLMGHAAGAFPGALHRREGQIEQSHQGTLFLDEIDLAPRAAQLLLLRVLEEREVLPLGAMEPHALDLRILAAAKDDPIEAVARGDLREDLYYRLNVVRLRTPPLRERRDDIPLLFARFLGRAADRLGRDIPPINNAIRRRLLEHDWPGNLRELANYASEIAVGLSATDTGAPSETGLARQVQAYEAELIREALVLHHGDIRRVTATLRIPRKTLYDKMARHGIVPAAHRTPASG
ncbi:sigma-54 dependent transcriptional regulator [Roseibacterium beibuensis]|uniref:sigma-54-dependent transcriptional regulator n=1 Tax=[Roseibacterium] beibuensis TaxID=1193142 RepID=UPI00217D0C44|nr:sigma-54 dependent transcriptional regulator [Roseibacterium beibuensis]MCS6622564.1 sigma-54 dependent transcriptional regulator [Roseibacterium beibuensis]